MSAVNDGTHAMPASELAPAPSTELPVQDNDEVELVPEDEATDDSASELGESVASSSTSISSSIQDYRVENGRTYHKYKDGNLQHNLFLLTWDNTLGLAPPNKPNSMVKRVLDVGTGTGIWAMDFAEDHPDAEVLNALAFFKANIMF
ncbi:hypothetical protein CCHL11_09381 [Colletotrichum chlorophyti]|uniref:Uncharacterized protein n=1 Tax=Colletotrichum chlorophyti TaxID=708187 RepID=A0A1Q8RA95_9PEZI|nr:hypothetical protein CCHL11_09381 [Colletotrichum chlorophyti]